MGVYISRLFFVCAAAALCDIICNHTSGKSIAKAVNLVCSLCVCLTVFAFFFDASAVADGFSSITDEALRLSSEDASEANELTLIENTRKELENNISDAILKKYGIKCQSVSIDFNIERKDGITDVTVSEISVTVPSKDTDSFISAVKSYLEEMFGCKVHIE